MTTIARIFHRTRDMSFDMILQGVSLQQFMANVRTDGWTGNEGVYIPYDQIGLVLTYESGTAAPVFTLVPGDKDKMQ